MDLEQVMRDVRDRIEENANNFSLDFLAAAWHYLHQIRDAFQQIVVEGRAADLRIDGRAGGGDNQLGFDPRTVLLAMARLRELNEEPMRRAMHRVLEQIRGILRTLDIYAPFVPQQPREIVHNMLMQAVPGIIAPHHPPEILDFMAMMGQDVALAQLGRFQQHPMVARPGGNDIQRMVRNNLMHIAGRNQAANAAEEEVEEERWDWSDDEIEEDEDQEDEVLELEEFLEDDEDPELDELVGPAAVPEAPEEEDAAPQPDAVPEAPMDAEQAAAVEVAQAVDAAPVAPMDAEVAAAMMPAAAIVDLAQEAAANVALLPDAPQEHDAAQALVQLAGVPVALEQPVPARPAGLLEPIPRQMPAQEQERHVIALLNQVEDQLGVRMVEQMEAINRMMLNLDVMANQGLRGDAQVQRRLDEVRQRRRDQFNEIEDAMGPFRRAVQRLEAGDRHALDVAERQRQRAQQAVRENPGDLFRRRQLMDFDVDVEVEIRARRRALEARQRERLRAADPAPPAPPVPLVRPAPPAAPPAPRGILIDRRPPMRRRGDGMRRFRHEFVQMREYLGLDDEDDHQEVPAKRYPESEKIYLLRGSYDIVHWRAEKVLQWLGLFIKNRDDLEFMEYKHYNGRQLFKILDSDEKWEDEKIPFGLYCKMAACMNRMINEHNGYLFEKNQ